MRQLPRYYPITGQSIFPNLSAESYGSCRRRRHPQPGNLLRFFQTSDQRSLGRAIQSLVLAKNATAAGPPPVARASE